jgi:hypothetical protein
MLEMIEFISSPRIWLSPTRTIEPVTGIGEIAFFLVNHAMEPRRQATVVLLNNFVSGIPFAFTAECQCAY